MLRIHTDDYVPKYRTGHWFWQPEADEVRFHSNYEHMMAAEIYCVTGGFKFLQVLDQVEEAIFRQEFQRDDSTFDADVVLLQDVIDLVMFLSPSEIITKQFVHFIKTKTVHAFLHALIIYFEHYLRLAEMLLIRRDDISGDMPRMQSKESIQIKQVYSSRLQQYRLLLAREYSKILLGEGDMKRFHHFSNGLCISRTLHDRAFHESFLAFSFQVVWITMHRRAYDAIEMEMDRLFRSEHFSLQVSDQVKFTEAERKVLYGRNYKRVNYRAQNSPIVQEITHVSKENLPILWIGQQKYRGTDRRINELEMEFIVPSSQLPLINVTHGILGHPKKLYNTMLHLSWEAVRAANYSDAYDPYNLITQPHLMMPNLNEETLRKHAVDYGSVFEVVSTTETWDKAMVDKWMQRDKVVQHFKSTGMLTNIWVKCAKELNQDRGSPSVCQITLKFVTRVEKLRKKQKVNDTRVGKLWEKHKVDD